MNDEKIKIKRLTKTCSACPSQWEGETDEGRHIYIRYRFSNLTCGIAKEKEKAVDASIGFVTEDNKEAIRVYVQHGEEYDGVMDYETMAKLLGNNLDFSECIETNNLKD